MKFLKEKIIRRFSAMGPKTRLGLVILVLALLIVPQVTRAQVNLNPIAALSSMLGIGDVLSTAVGHLMYYASYILSTIMGVVVGVEAWIIEVVLNLNTQIVNSPPVHFGFPVALSIANLGFTAAIIVIAIATILRWSGYGIKQILWKLVVAALLVNFSLVFAGAILNFADQFTLYFLNQVNPRAEGNSFNAFASSFAGAFNPQKSFALNGNGSDLSALDVEKISGVGLANTLSSLLLPLISLVFVVFSLAATVITLGVFIFMLLYRYVALGILLILMPFAWLLWIFPGLSSNWSKWWNQFLKQVFFAPLVIFFLYLAILTSKEINLGQNGHMDLTAFTDPSKNDIWSGIVNFSSNLFSPFVQNVMNMIIIVGITLGGLYVANQLSIVGAKAGMGAFKSFGGKVGGMAKDRAKRVGGWGLKKTGAEGAAKSLAGLAGRAQGSRLLRMTGVSSLLGAGLGAVATGATRMRVATEEKMVKEKEKEMGGKATDVLKTMQLTATGAAKIAILKELMKRGELGDISIDKTITSKNKELYASFGQEKAFEDMEKSVMTNVEMANLKRAGADKEKIKDAAIEFAKTYKKEDVASMHLDDVYGKKPKFGRDENTHKEFQEIIGHGIGVGAPAIIPNSLGRMKGDSINNFEPAIRNGLEAEKKFLQSMEDLDPRVSSDWGDAERDKWEKYTGKLGLKERATLLDIRDKSANALKGIDKALTGLEKTMARNAMGLGGVYGGGGGRTPREEDEEEE